MWYWLRPAAVLVASLAVAGCAAEPGHPPRRVLVEAHAPAFVARVLADPAFAFYRTPRMRAAIEEDGRAVCSQILLGVPPHLAHDAAYPPTPGYPPRRPDEVHRLQLTARHAAEVLCPVGGVPQ